LDTFLDVNLDKNLDKNLGQASIPAISQYIQLAKKQHIDVDSICEKLGINHQCLNDNSQHITGLQFQQIIAELIDSSDDELFGLHTAQFVQPGSYNVLGYISMNCKDLGQAITKIQPFEKLVGDMGTTKIEQLGSEFKISWHCPFPNVLVRRHMIDNCLASWLTFARYLVAKQSNPSKVLLSREQPNLSQQTEYQNIFNCPISYGQKENAIIFATALLSLPLNKGNQQLLTSLESHASELMSMLATDDSFKAQVCFKIANTLSQGNFHQSDIAQLMNISTKTLQRKLTAEGVKFQALLDETRLVLAENLLKSHQHNLNYISSCLGFTEPRSFYRWFNKLKQKTPGEYRNDLLGNTPAPT